jgi:tetratricopeptide (TPR) repeat protein
LQAGQLPAACRAADAGCQRYPESSLLRVMQARLLLEMGKKEQALESLKFIAPPPITLSSDYYALLATLQQQNGDLVGALSTYQLLTAAFPQRGDWWIGSAICAEQLGKHQQAAIYYEQALRCSQLQVSLKQYALQQLQHLAKR